MWRENAPLRELELGLDAAYSQSFTEDTSPPQTSGEFNTRAQTSAYTDIKTRMLDLKKALKDAAGVLSLAELNELVEDNEESHEIIKTNRMDHLWDYFKTRIGALSDPGSPELGKRFLAGMKRAGCETVIDRKIECSATYVSYVYSPNQPPSFINRIKVNPKHIGSEDSFINATAHEYDHAFQKYSAPALHLSPSNADSRAVIHPRDWMRLELFCERNAFTMQALINTIMAKDNPAIRENSKYDVVSVDEFEAIRKKFPRLEDAVVACSLQALTKDYYENDSSQSFVDYYHDVALNNYRIGMNARKAHKDTDLVFVRLEDSDLWQVGNHGVIPNSFGEYVPEKLAFVVDPMRAEEQKKYDKLCKDFNIPDYDSCPTLAEYDETINHTGHNVVAISAFRQAPILAYA